MIDLVFFDDLKVLQDMARELEISTFVIAKCFSLKELNELKKRIREQEFDFKTCMLIDSIDYKKLNFFKNKVDFVAVLGGSIELNKFAVQRKEVNLLINPVNEFKPTVDTAIVRESLEKNTPIVFSSTYFNSLTKLKKAYFFKNALTTIKLINKFKSNALFFSCARKKSELINLNNFAKQFIQLGFSEKQLNYFLNEFPFKFFKTPIVPSYKQALKLLKEKNVPENIVEHSKQVTNIALFVGKKLKAKGFEINLDLLGVSALLHDIAKYYCVKTSENHAIVGAKWLREKGFEKIAKIVSEHGTSQVLKENPFCCIESKILFYADKRVNSNKIVTIKERFDYLFKKYGVIGEEVQQTLKKCYTKVLELEKELIKENKIDLKGFN